LSAPAGELLGRDGPIAGCLDDYEARPQQLALATAVEDALATRTHLLAEAGTGIGKSFAYLVPAIQHAVAHRGEGPVVVSTRTIALQQQLEQKDLPFLQSALDLDWSAVTAVGRNHHLCLRRMHLARQESQLLFADPERQAQLAAIVEWSLSTRSGMRMALPEPVPNEVWEEVRAEHQNCLHRACPYYEPCHYQRARRRMDGADILVVNHALYMADVALRMAGAAYLPAHRVVIFDEAHHLERVATESLGLRFTRGMLRWHLRRLHPRNRERSLLSRYGTSRAQTLVRQLRMVGDEFFEDLARRLEVADQTTLALNDTILAGGDELAGLLTDLAQELTCCADAVESVDMRTELHARARGFETMQFVVRSLCNPVAGPGDPNGQSGQGREQNMVRWLETVSARPELRSAPLDVSVALQKHVFDDQHTCVLTSATLGSRAVVDVEMEMEIDMDVDAEAGAETANPDTADGGFPWFRRRLGISKARTLRLGSPFRYDQQVRVVLEEALPDPARDPGQYLEEARHRILHHLLENAGRALVLCTSWHFVERLTDFLRPRLEAQDLRLLVQGEAPLPHLLHQKQQDPESVLLGTDSLWEGIDIKGEALTLLILTRFPFAQPDHPLTQARLRRIEAQGGSGFWDHTLPEALLKFRQGFGRLVRSTTDTGKVVVLDPRVRTRRYGREFLRALPTGLGALDQEPI
jgi:ATP-dependent DNA helicase DinG